MNRLKIFVVIGMIIAFCSSFTWAGSIEIMAIDENENALVNVSLCGGGTIDDLKVVSSDDTFYIFFSASETGEENCEISQEIIPIPPCSAYSKIVALLYSEITLLDDTTRKDLSMDSLYVDLDGYVEGCCQNEYETCIVQCDDVEGCETICDENFDQCLATAVPEITVDCKPETLNLKSKGKYVTCYLMSSDVDGINDIDTNTLELHYLDTSLSAIRSEFEEDQLMVKFDRQMLQALIKATTEGIQFPVTIELSVSGKQNGNEFEATDSMRVKQPKKKKKK